MAKHERSCVVKLISWEQRVETGYYMSPCSPSSQQVEVRNRRPRCKCEFTCKCSEEPAQAEKGKVGSMSQVICVGKTFIKSITVIEAQLVDSVTGCASCLLSMSPSTFMPTSRGRVKASLRFLEPKAGVGFPALPPRESWADHLPSLGLSSSIDKVHTPPDLAWCCPVQDKAA